MTLSRFENFNFGPNFTITVLGFDNKNNFYIGNGIGREIIKYNLKGDSLDTFKINKFININNKEIDKYKNLFFKKIKNRKQFNKFKKEYDLSFMAKLLYDKKNNNFIIRYFLRNIFIKLANLPPAKSYLLVYSLDKRKAISDFIPINFIPLNIDTDKRELIGVQQRKGDIFLQFYKWEY